MSSHSGLSGELKETGCKFVAATGAAVTFK